MKAVFKNKITDIVFTPPTDGWLWIKNTHKLVNKPRIKAFTVRDSAYSFTYELGIDTDGSIWDVLVNLERTPANSWGYKYEGERALYELRFLWRKSGKHLRNDIIKVDMKDIRDLDLFYAIIVEKSNERV
jgi:hypothetical protein